MIDRATVYTLAEAAEAMRLPYRVVRDAVFAGRWSHIKVSARRRLMTGEDILAALESMKQEPVEPPTEFERRASKERVRRLISA